LIVRPLVFAKWSAAVGRTGAVALASMISRQVAGSLEAT